MTDRELLEAAAKAAEIDLWHADVFTTGLTRKVSGDGVLRWNPLTDDGDALRLAVKLQINIEHMKTLGGEMFGINCWPSGRGDCGVSEDGDLIDYQAATRRAIVRAAAAMDAA